MFVRSHLVALLHRIAVRLLARPAYLIGLVTALAILAVISVPVPESGALHLYGALWLMAVLAGLALRRSCQRIAAPPPLLLTRNALRHPPLPMPPALLMRAELGALLASPAPRRGAPETAEHALRRVLEKCLASHGGSAMETLSRPALIELWVLVTLLRAAPERAGALAQCFRMPHRVLALRDRMPPARSAQDGCRAEPPRLRPRVVSA